MHISQLLLHVGCGKHVDIFEAQWFHNVLEEIVVQSHAANTLDELAGPVNIDAVFPYLTRLVDEWLAEILPWVSGELVQSCLAVVVVESFVEEGISKPSYAELCISVRTSGSLRLWTNLCATRACVM